MKQHTDVSVLAQAAECTWGTWGVHSGGEKDEREKTVLGCSHMKEMLSF